MCSCKLGYAGVDCSIKLEERLDAWQIFSIVLGCMLFVIVSLLCEIIGSRRRHDHDNLQVHIRIYYEIMRFKSCMFSMS